MPMLERLSKKAAGMGKEAAESAVAYVRKVRWSDVTGRMKRNPVQTLVTLTAVGFFTGYLAGRR